MRFHYHPLTGVNIHFSEDETSTALFYLECLVAGFEEAGNQTTAENISAFVDTVKSQEKQIAHS